MDPEIEDGLKELQLQTHSRRMKESVDGLVDYSDMDSSSDNCSSGLKTMDKERNCKAERTIWV